MKFGNNIDIDISVDGGGTKASVRYNGQLVSGIQSVECIVSAGSSGEELNRLVFAIWDPNEIYNNDEQSSIQHRFIEDARRSGASVKILSVFDQIDAVDDIRSAHDSNDINEDVVSSFDGTAKLAASCLAIVGIASLLLPKGKKQTVQSRKTAAIEAAEHHSVIKRK